MRARPEELETSAVIGALADGWDLAVEGADYAPVGGGSYHWVVSAVDGERWFVTVDDLDQKAWLGETRDAVFAGLTRAFETAAVLRDAGLELVVAPVRASDGRTTRRIGPRYTLALFPFVDGQAGRFGDYDHVERLGVASLLAQLHAATPAVDSVARRMDLALPGRAGLESALHDLDSNWLVGPYSEPARRTLSEHASEVAEFLALHDRLAGEVARGRAAWAITHGEPHAGNVLESAGRYLIVDWDTVALGPRERDLWMLVGDTPDAVAAYVEATGHELDQTGVDFFGLTWDLADLAAFTGVLRAPHGDNADTAKAYEALRTCVALRDRREARRLRTATQPAEHA